MFESARLLPAIALFVFAAMSLLAIETSETLSVDGRSPSERLSLALISVVDSKANITTLDPNSEWEKDT